MKHDLAILCLIGCYALSVYGILSVAGDRKLRHSFMDRTRGVLRTLKHKE